MEEAELHQCQDDRNKIMQPQAANFIAIFMTPEQTLSHAEVLKSLLNSLKDLVGALVASRLTPFAYSCLSVFAYAVFFLMYFSKILP